MYKFTYLENYKLVVLNRGAVSLWDSSYKFIKVNFHRELNRLKSVKVNLEISVILRSSLVYKFQDSITMIYIRSTW